MGMILHTPMRLSYPKARDLRLMLFLLVRETVICCRTYLNTYCQDIEVPGKMVSVKEQSASYGTNYLIT
jgi:hypothetical protein